MWRKWPMMCGPFMVKWEISVPKCVILCDQMEEQHSVMCDPLESDGRTVPQNVSSFMVEWENGVPNCVRWEMVSRNVSSLIKWENNIVILYRVRWANSVRKCVVHFGQMRQQCPRICHPVQSSGRVVSQSMSSFLIKGENSFHYA
jgi:hypothetical protein